MSTDVNKCQRMSAYEQRTLRMTSVGQRMATVVIRKLYVKDVTQSSDIRQDVLIRWRYARYTLEVRYSHAINTLAVRYIFTPTYVNVCSPYLTYE